MGNIANEASTDLNPTLLESGSVKKSGLTGTQYTALVDAGSISREEVIHSSSLGIYSGGRYGYGLCGFTDPEIKSYLCKYTIDKGKSLGSISGQLDSLIAYLEKHNPSLLERLKTSDSVEDARHLILLRNQRKKMTQKIRHLRNQMLPHLSPHPLLRLQSLPKLQHQTYQPLRLSQKLILNPLKKMQIPVLHPQKTQIPLPIMRQKRLQ